MIGKRALNLMFQGVVPAAEQLKTLTTLLSLEDTMMMDTCLPLR